MTPPPWYAGDHLVAVGHDGVILHSDDRGERWQRVREEPYSPDNHASPSNGVPLLDVLFLDERRVLAGCLHADAGQRDSAAAGRHGKWWCATAFRPIGELPADPDGLAGGGPGDAVPDTGDADEVDSWSDAFLFSDDDLLLGDEADPHLNALARLADGRLVLVGERGSAWRSDDEGRSWQRLALPYAGSMYGLLAGSGSRLIAFGLRGRVLESGDGGDSWQLLPTGSLATLFDGTVTAAGDIVLVGGQPHPAAPRRHRCLHRQHPCRRQR